MERPVDAALEQREEALRRVDVGLAVAADVLASRVIDRAVRGELATEPVIGKAVVGAQMALAAGLRNERVAQCLGGHIGCVLGADPPATLHKGDDGLFLRDYALYKQAR